MRYKEAYYHANAQDRDRPALWMYERLWRRYLGKGPVLDFGCGLGHFARRLARYTEVFGLEINPFALEKLHEIAPQVQVIETMACLADGSFGSVTALHVFEHITDTDLASIGSDLKRILRPGGRILAVMPDLDGHAHSLKGKAWSAYRDSTHINLKGANEWRRFFEGRWKFDTVTCFADGYYDFPYGQTRIGSLPADFLRGIRTLVQFLLGRPILRQGDGENIVFILERPQ